MSELAIRCEHLSKQYRIGERESYKALRDVITDTATAPLRRLRSAFSNGNGSSGRNAKPKTRNSFWALDDVSFEVKRGEVMGVIGRNGAGKSTLLKILSRITKPTKGHAEIHGRVGSLLEVGTGFHPELTGRENIFLNGAILGMRKAEIERKFDEIVAFAEIEKFIDTPVKRYSSGMYVRLAFAVAAHMETEILLVDEVLAVGDADFQKKCLGKMDQASKREGKTVVMVSHNMQAISTLTTRGILLNLGKLVMQGPPAEVIRAHLAENTAREQVYVAAPNATVPSITRVEIQSSEPDSTHISGKPIRLIFDLSNPESLKSAAFSFQIVDPLMQPIVHLWVFDTDEPVLRRAGTHRLICEIPNLRLYKGRYSVTAHLSEREGGTHFQTLESVCPFEVVMFGKTRDWHWADASCRYLEEGNWTVCRL